MHKTLDTVQEGKSTSNAQIWTSDFELCISALPLVLIGLEPLKLLSENDNPRKKTVTAPKGAKKTVTHKKGARKTIGRQKGSFYQYYSYLPRKNDRIDTIPIVLLYPI